jgi:tetratricopeptide (TPR) repeat protein
MILLYLVFDPILPCTKVLFMIASFAFRGIDITCRGMIRLQYQSHKGDVMRVKIACIIMVMMVTAIAPAGWAADEPLFDTKAAAAGLEKGLALVKAKKFDAAVAAFEEAAATSPDVEAEAYYYAGYAYYLKSKTGDEDSRQKSVEFFDRVYEINPNFSPNKFKPVEPMPGAAAKQGGEVTPASVAPTNTLAVPPINQAPAAPATTEAPATPPVPTQQPK